MHKKLSKKNLRFVKKKAVIYITKVAWYNILNEKS